MKRAEFIAAHYPRQVTAHSFATATADKDIYDEYILAKLSHPLTMSHKLICNTTILSIKIKNYFPFSSPHKTSISSRDSPLLVLLIRDNPFE